MSNTKEVMCRFAVDAPLSKMGELSVAINDILGSECEISADGDAGLDTPTVIGKQSKHGLAMTSDPALNPIISGVDYNDLDTDGQPWDKLIHTEKRTKTAKGVWKLARGVDKELVANTQAKHKAALNPATQELIADLNDSDAAQVAPLVQPAAQVAPVVQPAAQVAPVVQPAAAVELVGPTYNDCVAVVGHILEINPEYQNNIDAILTPLGVAGLAQLLVNHADKIPAAHAQLNELWVAIEASLPAQ